MSDIGFAGFVHTGVEVISFEPKFVYQSREQQGEPKVHQQNASGKWGYVVTVAAGYGPGGRLRNAHKVTIWVDHEPDLEDGDVIIFTDMEGRIWKNAKGDSGLTLSATGFVKAKPATAPMTSTAKA